MRHFARHSMIVGEELAEDDDTIEDVKKGLCSRLAREIQEFGDDVVVSADIYRANDDQYARIDELDEDDDDVAIMCDAIAAKRDDEVVSDDPLFEDTVEDVGMTNERSSKATALQSVLKRAIESEHKMFNIRLESMKQDDGTYESRAEVRMIV